MEDNTQTGPGRESYLEKSEKGVLVSLRKDGCLYDYLCEVMRFVLYIKHQLSLSLMLSERVSTAVTAIIQKNSVQQFT